MRLLVCSIREVPAGTTKSVQLDGMPELAVCNVDGTFHILTATCSHGQASLAEGRLLGCEVECPLHAGRFDVRTGRATRRPAKRPVATYECLIEDENVYVTVPTAADPGPSPRSGCEAATAAPQRGR